MAGRSDQALVRYNQAEHSTDQAIVSYSHKQAEFQELQSQNPTNCSAILNEIVKWMWGCIPEGDRIKARKEIAEELLKGFPQFLKIIRAAVQALAMGMKLLEEFKNEIIKVLNENQGWAKQLVRIGTQVGILGIVTKVVAKTSMKGAGIVVKAATPVSIVADLAQGGLEHYGYKGAGKTVGIVGNIAGGAMIGLAGGPVGVAFGALGGFGAWVIGEAAGRVADKVLT